MVCVAPACLFKSDFMLVELGPVGAHSEYGMRLNKKLAA